MTRPRPIRPGSASMPAGWADAVVRETSTPAVDVRGIVLEPAGGVRAYAAGSHIDVEVQIDGRPATRSYSLVGAAPKGGAYHIAVKHLFNGRGGSRYLWDIQPGDQLRISLPKNHFELNHGAPEYLLLAGGIGITPLLGMAEVLADHGANFRLLYAGRTRAQMAFLSQLETRFADRLAVFTDEQGPELNLQQEFQRLDSAAQVYVCGPLGLMAAAQRAWREAQRPPANFRLETFGTSGHLPPVPFAVHVRDRGVRLVVAKNQTLLDALRNNGIEMAGHCLRGECGVCAVSVLETDGAALDHRDVFLSEAQKANGSTLCACVSRATGPVTIDTGYRPVL